MLRSNLKLKAEGGRILDNKLNRQTSTAGHAFFNQPAEKIEFNENVYINVTPKENAGEMSQPTDIQLKSQQSLYFSNKQLNQIDLDGNVYVYQKPTNNPKWTKTKANRAMAKIDKGIKTSRTF